jgi:hypothetical protein
MSPGIGTETPELISEETETYRLDTDGVIFNVLKRNRSAALSLLNKVCNSI